MASGDKPKYTSPVVNGITTFEVIDAGKYYARLYEDFNGDGKYTPGSYRLQKVFGEPSISLDSVAAISGDSINLAVDSVSMPVVSISADSIPILTDSIDVLTDSIHGVADSISTASALSIDRTTKRLIKPLTDQEILDSLRRIGYSLIPIETDSVGKDILIALQPDYVYYYPKTINVKKNWDMEQSWNVFETALDLQKPNKIKKNKPKRNNNIRESQEEEEEEEDEFGANPFDTNRRNTNNNRGINRNSNVRRQY